VGLVFWSAVPSLILKEEYNMCKVAFLAYKILTGLGGTGVVVSFAKSSVQWKIQHLKNNPFPSTKLVGVGLVVSFPKPLVLKGEYNIENVGFFQPAKFRPPFVGLEYNFYRKKTKPEIRAISYFFRAGQSIQVKKYLFPLGFQYFLLFFIH
jgi:hypothetical protein